MLLSLEQNTCATANMAYLMRKQRLHCKGEGGLKLNLHEHGHIQPDGLSYLET